MILLAQEASAWATVISSIVNVGFSVTVAAYLLVKAIPDMQKTFENSLEKQAEHFDRIDEKRHLEHKSALESVIKHCEREAERRDVVLKSEMAIVDKSLTSVGEVMEEVREELRKKT